MTTEEVARISQFRSEGLNWGTIGATFGVTAGAIQGKYWRATNPEKSKAGKRKARAAAKPVKVSPNGPVTADQHAELRRALESRIAQAHAVEHMARHNREQFEKALTLMGKVY